MGNLFPAASRVLKLQWGDTLILHLGSLQLFTGVTRATLDFIEKDVVYEDNCKYLHCLVWSHNNAHVKGALYWEMRRLLLHLPAENQDSIDKIDNHFEAVYSKAATFGDPRTDVTVRRRRVGESNALELQDIAAEIHCRERVK